MKILLLSLNFWPEKIGIGKYSAEMAFGLSERGHEVRVVCAPPYYPQWQIEAEYLSQGWTRQKVRSLEVWRVPLWVPRRVTGLSRLLHLLSFGVSVWPALLAQSAWKPDVVFCVAPALFSAPAGWLSALWFGAETWLHMQDFELDAALGLAMLPFRHLWLPLARAWESWLLRRFGRVSSLSPAMCALAQAKGVNPARLRLLPNWVDTDRVFPSTAPNPLRLALRLPEGRPIVLYHGNMGFKQGLETVIEAARWLQGQASVLFFLLVGEGAARKALQERALGLDNLLFAPLQPEENLNDLVNLADIHVLPQRREAADLVMPSKLTTMLASGKPVVACAFPETQLEKTLRSCGLIVPPEDPQALAQALLALAQDPARATALGQAGRAYAQTHYSRAAILDQLSQELQNRPYST